MKPILLILLVPISLSCSKLTEDRVEGRWRLDKSYYDGLFNRDYFNTGYESGTFYFSENGEATFQSPTDTLSGYWSADFYTVPGDDPETFKYLHIELANFSTNRWLILDFDDYNFRRNWNCLRAEQFRNGRNKYYEFVRP